MRLRVLPAAVADLLEGARLYEEKEDGLGRYFFDCLTSDIESLLVTAGVHRKAFGLHRLISRRFPYAAYYTLQNDAIVVWRVLDSRQDPRRIARALQALVP